jgi:hypothetical protein
METNATNRSKTMATILCRSILIRYLIWSMRKINGNKMIASAI